MNLDNYLDLWGLCTQITQSMPVIKESILVGTPESIQAILVILSEINPGVSAVVNSLEESGSINSLEIVVPIMNGLGLLSEAGIAGPNVITGGDGVYFALAEGIRHTAECFQLQLSIADLPSSTHNTDSFLDMGMLRFALGICIFAASSACVAYNMQHGIESTLDASDTCSVISSVI